MRYLVSGEVNDGICNLAASVLDVGNEGAGAEPQLEIAVDDDEFQVSERCLKSTQFHWLR